MCHASSTISLPEFCCVSADPINDPFDPCNYSYNPCTCDGIGCFDGVSGGGSWPSNLVLFQDQDEGKKILSISDYVKCFNTSSTAQLSIFIDQPKSNSRETWSGSPLNPDVGHTFISITQNGQTRVFGYYPNSGVNPLSSNPAAPSVLQNDSGHAYDVKLTTSLTSTELKNVLNFVKTYKGIYNLNTYNCTDFAIQCVQKAGVSVTDTNGSWPGGGGSNPGDFGQDVRSLAPSSNYTVQKTAGIAPTNSGTCK